MADPVALSSCYARGAAGSGATGRVFGILRPDRKAAACMARFRAWLVGGRPGRATRLDRPGSHRQPGRRGLLDGADARRGGDVGDFRSAEGSAARELSAGGSVLLVGVPDRGGAVCPAAPCNDRILLS